MAFDIESFRLKNPRRPPGCDLLGVSARVYFHGHLDFVHNRADVQWSLAWYLVWRDREGYVFGQLVDPAEYDLSALSP